MARKILMHKGWYIVLKILCAIDQHIMLSIQIILLIYYYYLPLQYL